MDIEQNNTGEDETEQNVGDTAVSIEQNGKDIDKSVEGVDKTGYIVDTDIEQNKTAKDETEKNVGDKAVSIEQNEKKDIDKSVAGVDKMNYSVDKESRE